SESAAVEQDVSRRKGQGFSRESQVRECGIGFLQVGGPRDEVSWLGKGAKSRFQSSRHAEGVTGQSLRAAVPRAVPFLREDPVDPFRFRKISGQGGCRVSIEVA